MKNKMKNKIGRTGGEKNGEKNSAPKRVRRFIIGTAAAVFAIHSAAAEVSAVATIAPLHSILQNIVGETDAVHLLVDPDGSPHHARLSPSRARLLQNADAVFYLDESFERFIKRPLRTTPENARIRLANHLRIAKYNEHYSDERDSEHDSEHENHSDEHENPNTIPNMAGIRNMKIILMNTKIILMNTIPNTATITASWIFIFGWMRI